MDLKEILTKKEIQLLKEMLEDILKLPEFGEEEIKLAEKIIKWI